MIKKILKQLVLVINNKCQHAESREYQKKYAEINKRLLENPFILNAFHSDLKEMQVPGGKESHYTSDLIMRMLIVKGTETLSWRDTIVRIETDMELRQFTGIGINGKLPNYSYLCGANKFIKKETWKKINNLLLQDAISRKEVTGEKLRVDTTLCETNIHYPTDSSLLWDSFKVLSANIRLFRKLFPHIYFGYRFHNKKVKKLYSYISRNINNKSKSTKRTVNKRYNLLIEQVQRACEAANFIINMMNRHPEDIEAIEQLKHYLPIVAKVIHQTDMRINHGIILPSEEKIYSVYEPHTELIKRGKAGKPVEFGHMVMIAQTGEKFISDYEVMEVKRPDKDLVSPLLDNHKKKFGAYPEYLAGDKGFHESPEKTLELEEDVGMVCIPKKGKRTEDQRLKEHSDEFKEMQSFRAGSEGSISTLKRAYGMRRSLLRTFNTFAANIGCAAFCYNLVLLSKM